MEVSCALQAKSSDVRSIKAKVNARIEMNFRFSLIALIVSVAMVGFHRDLIQLPFFRMVEWPNF